MVKLTIHGEVWEFSTASEAAEFKCSLSASTPMPPERTRRNNRPTKAAVPIRGRLGHKPRHATAPTNTTALTDGARQILEAIRRNPNGLKSEEFARAIGCQTLSQVPVRMMVLGKELKALGFKPKEVVHRDRIYVKGAAKSVFKPGARLDDALRRDGDLFAVAK